MHSPGEPGSGTPADPTRLQIGDLTGPVGTVDAKGTLRRHGRSWRLEWGIGAEDRWHVAAEEVAVRHALLDDTPVAVTAMRAPGGDIVQRAAGVSDGVGRAVSLEFANETGTPVALALAVRQGGGRDGPGTVVVEGDRVIVGDEVVLALDRVPGGTVVGEDDRIWDLVREGPTGGDRSAPSRRRSGAAAVVLPLPHRQEIRVVVPVGEPVPEVVPATAVAAGWRALASRAATIELGDGDTVARWRRGVPALVLAAGTSDLGLAAAVAPVLDRVGLPDEGDRARVTLVDAVEQGLVSDRLAAAVAVALASRRLRCGRASGLVELVGVLIGGARGAVTPDERDLIADALETEDERAARDVRDLVPSSGLVSPRPGDVESILDRIVQESSDGIDLLPAPEQSWLGHPLDVRGVVTRHGPVSFSVRWHGGHPALLWELRSDRKPEIRCSGLDPAWHSRDTYGEVLLGAG